MAEEKVYRASTGVDEFYYGEMGDGITAAYIESKVFTKYQYRNATRSGSCIW